MRLSEFDCSLNEARNQKSVPLPAVQVQDTSPTTAELEVCPFFDETTSAYKKDQKMRDKITAFMDFKKASPMDRFNKTDTNLAANGPYAQIMPGMRKAHLTQDISIWYTLSSSNPTLVHLYAVLTHEQSGTGTPAKVARQVKVANKMKQQSFTRM